jgi:hypothetical protein
MKVMFPASLVTESLLNLFVNDLIPVCSPHVLHAA